MQSSLLGLVSYNSELTGGAEKRRASGLQEPANRGAASLARLSLASVDEERRPVLARAVIEVAEVGEGRASRANGFSEAVVDCSRQSLRFGACEPGGAPPW